MTVGTAGCSARNRSTSAGSGAKAGKFQIENLGKNRVFSDYRVTNPESGGQYTVTIRGFDVGDNTCTCPDFKANTLGTCKHIEAVLDHLKDELPAHLQQKKAAVTRPEIYLHYGEQLRLGLHLPPRHSDKLARLADAFFDEKGLWSGKREVPRPDPRRRGGARKR